MDVKFYSQKGQDQWLIEEVFNGKYGGFFLDLAASDGIKLSNTYLLELHYKWKGICIEPNPFFFQQLCKNRNTTCLERCIDGTRHAVEFVLFNELGGIVDDDTDNNTKIRQKQIDQARLQGAVITLHTMLLEEVLKEVDAPETIDYFSFDVEGAETRILKNFPFHKYRFMAMTIERSTVELNKLLFLNGYVFVKNRQFDSFYVHETLENIEQIQKEPFVQITPKDW